MIHHIAMIISSEECLHFYKSLGFVETFRKVREQDVVVLLNGHEIQLEAFIDPRHPVRPSPEPLGLRHFALKVNNIEDVVKELGLKVAPSKPIGLERDLFL